MAKFKKIKLSPGIFWLEHKASDLRILCGPAADSVKFMLKRGLIRKVEQDGFIDETGPNSILLSDVALQKGDLCNLSEFPVLQILYRQGFMLPGHRQNTGQKPLIIGSREQVASQVEYIFRGNYGLARPHELEDVCSNKEQIEIMKKVKKFFAFGRITPSEDLLDTIVIGDDATLIKGDVRVKRTALNQFEFFDGEESIHVNLNLGDEETYRSPLSLNPIHIPDQFFSIIHSGEGDGWDIDHGCMGSVINFNHRYYLIDAAPNIRYTLQSLGISLSCIEGIFITHAHDDHFAGLTSLLQGHKPIKVFATPWVRKSIAAKFSALLRLPVDYFYRLFSIHDLEDHVWNRIDGLEVMPEFSPHPIETSTFKFRFLWDEGYKTYTHLADIASFSVIDRMQRQEILSEQCASDIKKRYLANADLKKVDIGGGLIHGQAQDFRGDTSKKIILAHKSDSLSTEEKQIGSSSPFGSVDILVPSQSNYPTKKIEDFLHQYFPMVESHEFRSFLQCPLKTHVAGSLIFREDVVPEKVLLIESGIVEKILSERDAAQDVLAGTIIGDGELVGHNYQATYRAKSYVTVLEIPKNVYQEFIERLGLIEYLSGLYEKYYELSHTLLFRSLGISSNFLSLIANMKPVTFQAGDNLRLDSNFNQDGLLLIKTGMIKLEIPGSSCQLIGPGEFCFEDLVIDDAKPFQIECYQSGSGFFLPKEEISRIPIIFWQILESYEKRCEGKWLFSSDDQEAS